MQLTGVIFPWPAGTLTWAERGRDLLAAERGRFVLFLPVLMGVGDLVYFAGRNEPWPWLGAVIAVPSLLAAMVLRGRPLFRAAALAAGSLALGFAAAQLAAMRAAPAAGLPTRAVVISGTVAAVETLPEGRRITLEKSALAPDAPPLARSLRIRLRNDDAQHIAAGDTIRVRALVRPPSPPAYPGAWDLQRDAWFDGIGGYGYALGPVESLARAMPGWAATFVQALREKIAARIQGIVPGAAGAVAATLLTGLAAAIPPDDRAAFRDSGLAHLLAIAGLHVGIVMGLVFGFTRFTLALSERAALMLPIKQIAGVLALLAGGLYMVLTGMHVPILRSVTMASVVTLALLTGRRAVSLRGLLLAGAVLVLVAPEQIVGVSFQMSFSAVLFLIAGYEAMRPWLTRLHGDGSPWRRLAGHVATLALTSLLAGSASAPFAAYHFGHIQLYFVLANVIAVPLTALWIMPAGLLALALMPMGLDQPVLAVMGWGVQAVLAIARAIASWPAATLAVPHMPDWGLALVALGMVWLGLWRSRLRLAGVPLLVFGLASPLLARPPDVLVSADARLIALRTAAGVFAQTTPGAARFTREAWEQYFAAGPLRPLDAPQAAGAVACLPASCILRSRPEGPAALLWRNAAAPATCDPAGGDPAGGDPAGGDPAGGDQAVSNAAVVISAEPVRAGCTGPVPVVDRFTVWREGAQAIWLDPTGPRVLSDRAARGDRPWVSFGPQQKAAALLPPAETIPLPPD